MSTSEVHAAIQALYGQNAERQKAANAFLVQFASTPAAWETALALLGVLTVQGLDRGVHLGGGHTGAPASHPGRISPTLRRVLGTV